MCKFVTKFALVRDRIFVTVSAPEASLFVLHFYLFVVFFLFYFFYVGYKFVFCLFTFCSLFVICWFSVCTVFYLFVHRLLYLYVCYMFVISCFCRFAWSFGFFIPATTANDLNDMC